MKALTFAAIATIAMAGAACSQTEAADSDAPEVAAAETTAEQPAAPSGFNLRYPDGSTTASDSENGFNLSIPDSSPSDGYRLPPGTINEDRLGGIPEFNTPEAGDQPATQPVPVTPVPEDTDDDVIRLN